MSPLPVVYGTVGRIESLIDPSIYGRFADLPQNGKHFISSRTRNVLGGVCNREVHAAAAPPVIE